MKKTSLARCGPGSIAFVSYRSLSLINADHGDADRASATTLEFEYLVAKVVLHTVNLLNHRLCQYLHFDADLDCSYRSSGHYIARICQSCHARNELAESSIPAPGGNAVALVLHIQNPVINPFNKNAYRGLADADAPHRFTMSYVYATPGVRGAGRVTEYLTEHWSTSGVFSAQSGLPITITSNTDTSLTGNNGLVDLVGNPHLANSSLAAWFNKAAFMLPGAGSFGNAGRNILRAPGFWNGDLSAARDFPLGGEKRRLQFRSEFFNAFNHVNPDPPDTTITSPNFTRITSYRGPRTVQLSLKLLW